MKHSKHRYKNWDFGTLLQKNHQESALNTILGHFSIKKGGIYSNYIYPTP
jgi:hypothetical protein